MQALVLLLIILTVLAAPGLAWAQSYPSKVITIIVPFSAGGRLFPPVASLRDVARRIAEAVVREARDSGLARAITDEAIAAAVNAAQWEPRYPSVVPA
jgi:malic enzyme